MSRLVATMKLDVKLQARNQLYVIGVAVAVLMGVMVRSLVPVEHIGRGLAAFFILGLGGTTFMFGASMLLLEKGERTLHALQVSMITARDYVLSKVVTLTAFAMVESAIVLAISGRGVPVNYGLLLLGAAVLGAFYCLIGLALAAPFEAVTRFLLPTGTLAAMILQLPVLSLIEVGPDWVYYLIPTQAPLLLLRGAFEPLTSAQWAYAAVICVGMVAAAWVFCARRFRHHIQLPEA